MTVPVPPAQLINGPAAILSGPALAEASALIQWGIEYVRSRDGIAPSPRLLNTAEMIKKVAEAYRMSGLPKWTSEPAEAPSVQDSKELPLEVTATQAAQLLNFTDRHVRRIESQLGVV
jgi:hypothetical protein